VCVDRPFGQYPAVRDCAKEYPYGYDDPRCSTKILGLGIGVDFCLAKIQGKVFITGGYIGIFASFCRFLSHAITVRDENVSSFFQGYNTAVRAAI